MNSSTTRFVLTCLLLASPVLAPAQQPYAKVRKAAVEVLVDRHLNGSGCVIDSNGTVLTAAHLFPGQKEKIEVLTADRQRLSASLIARDLGHDIALLQLPARENGYAHLELAAQAPRPGDSLFVFGTPIYRHYVMIAGTVARDTLAWEFVNGRYVELLYVNGAAAKGMSGGPWVNPVGRVVGVQSSLLTTGNVPQGVAFVAPLEAIRKLLAKRQDVPYATLGLAVEELWEQPTNWLAAVPASVEGLVVKLVQKDGPADKAGIEVNTIIRAIDDKPVQFRGDFLELVHRHQPGDTVRLALRRPNGTDIVLEFTAGMLQ